LAVCPHRAKPSTTPAEIGTRARQAAHVFCRTHGLYLHALKKGFKKAKKSTVFCLGSVFFGFFPLKVYVDNFAY